MRPLLPALLPLAALAGCAGYALDYTKPKASLLTPELPRYGLNAAQSRCFGATLTERLTVWQMRQLQMMAAALARSMPDTAQLKPQDLLRAASFVKDPEVAPEVSRAIDACSLIPPPPPPVIAKNKTGEAEEAPGGSTVQNGPAEYHPSDELLAALEAFRSGDLADAARLSKVAAEAGDSGAQQFLGGLYAYGRGVPEDQKEAAKWFALAAAQGWSEAMNNLGLAYANGAGVERDPVEALKWYLLASARATEDREMVAENIRNLVAEMAVEDIQKAAVLANQWERERTR